MTKKRERITDAGIKPPRLIDSKDISADVEKFLASGGVIEKPEFRRDRLEQGRGTFRRWSIHATPPDVREMQSKGLKR